MLHFHASPERLGVPFCFPPAPAEAILGGRSVLDLLGLYAEAG